MATIREAVEAVTREPDIRHIVSVSGGKDSAALAVHIRNSYPEIPAEYVFCDTGTELPETYEYLERIEAVLGVEIKRLDALDLIGVRKKSGRTAFDWFLTERYSGFLPSPRMRWCTRALKIHPFERFVGDSKCFSYIGIRADENREGYQQHRKPPVVSQRPNILPVYPFKDDGLGLDQIRSILEDSGLGWPSYYRWRSRSGCFFCFYQQKGEWARLKKEHPDLFEKAISYERTGGENRFTWVDGKSLLDLKDSDADDPVADIDDTDGCAICHL